MKRLFFALGVLGCALLSPYPASADIRVSDTFHYKEFKGKPALCRDTIHRMLTTEATWEDMNISVDGNHIRADDRKFIRARQVGRAFVQAHYATSNIIEFYCYANGDVHISLRKPGESDEYCMDYDPGCWTKRARQELKDELGDGIRWQIEREARERRQRLDPHYSLTINTTPPDARVRILNIKPRYKPGISLRPGKYKIEVTKPGYFPVRAYAVLKNADAAYKVTLRKKSAEGALMDFIRAGDVRAVRRQIRHMDVNGKIDDMTPLAWVSMSPHKKSSMGIARLLLEAGARPADSDVHIMGESVPVASYVLTYAMLLSGKARKQAGDYLMLLKKHGASADREGMQVAERAFRKFIAYEKKMRARMEQLDREAAQQSKP